MLPTSDNGLDLGSAAKSWRTLYIDTSIVLGAAASKIVPGATSFAIRNNADNANNLIITDAGAATVRTSLTVTTALSVGTTASITGDLTVDTNVLKVDTSNNWVGVGTASPQAKLHVTETNSNFAMIRMSNTANDAGEKNWEFITRDDGRFEIRSLNDAWDSVNSTPLALQSSTGYVGMGTTSPQGKLHIADTDGGWLFWRTSGVNGTPQTILTGVTGMVYVLGIMVSSTSERITIAGAPSIGGTYDVSFPVGGASFRFSLSGGGTLSVARTGGSETASFVIQVLYR